MQIFNQTNNSNALRVYNNEATKGKLTNLTVPATAFF